MTGLEQAARSFVWTSPRARHKGCWTPCRVRNQAGFRGGFDGLPQAAQTAIITELALSPGGAVREADAGELQHFATTEEGAELVQEWRSRAGRKVGTIHDRVQRILGGMSAGEQETALAWFDNLTAAQAKSVLRGLAG